MGGLAQVIKFFASNMRSRFNLPCTKNESVSWLDNKEQSSWSGFYKFEILSYHIYNIYIKKNVNNQWVNATLFNFMLIFQKWSQLLTWYSFIILVDIWVTWLLQLLLESFFVHEVIKAISSTLLPIYGKC